MEDWKIYTEIDFSDLNVVKYNIDTRDFHCACQGLKDIDEPFKSFAAFEKNPDKFSHTQEELVAILNRLFSESGGPGRWRFLMLDSPSKGSGNWGMKYLRIFRVGTGLVVCNSEGYALSKDVLSAKVNLQYLNHIKYKAK